MSNPEPRAPAGSRGVGRILCLLGALVVAVAGAGCAPRRLVLPSGPGAPRPDFETVFDEATSGCRGVRTFSAELALSGRAAGRRIRRARVQAGLVAPGAVYLLAPAPAGPPVLILAARTDRGALLLPRDRVAVRDAPVRELLDALAGLDLGTADLQALLTGCVVPDRRPQGGREYAGLVAIDLEAAEVAWVRRQGDRWRVVAGQRAGLAVEYSGYGTEPGATPRALDVRSLPPASAAVDLHVRLSQVELNVPLDPETFSVVIPPGVESITVEELREWAPLAR